MQTYFGQRFSQLLQVWCCHLLLQRWWFMHKKLFRRVGMIAGLMFGLMFGVSGIAAAGLGHLADINGIEWVFGLCSLLPLLGFATALLPNTKVK